MWNLEIIFAFIIWIAGVCYSMFAVVNEGEYFRNYEDTYGDFKDGWLVSGQNKDVADAEWQRSLTILYDVYPWLISNILGSEYFRYNKHFKVIPLWQLILGLSFTFYSIGILCSFIVVLQPILFQKFYKFRRKSLIWVCSCCCLALITYFKTLKFDTAKHNMFYYNENQTYFFIMATCWMNLRCLSYYLELIDTNDVQHNLIQVLAYCFYLPTLFLGPFISFSSFERSKNDHFEQTLTERVNVLLFSILRFGIWFFVAEYFLHYVYVNALSYHPELVGSFNGWSLYGYGYAMGQFFHLKYVVFYGISTSLAKFEHIVTPPIPKCIGRIHLYSDMWRYFDVGLYKFLVRYIYLPSLMKNNLMNKMFSSFLCFLFVYIWHGIQNHILVWVILNFLGITIENIFTNVCNYYNINHFLNRRLQCLLLCIFTSPLLAISALSNFYFFAGMEIGSKFTERLLYGPWRPTAVLLFLLTCCCYVSVEVKRWELHSNVQKKHTVTFNRIVNKQKSQK